MSHAFALLNPFLAAVILAQTPPPPTCAGSAAPSVTTAVHVSPTGADGSSCGSQTAPCQTIQEGIQRCSGAGCGVLVRYGLYHVSAPVSLANGVSVYGSCRWGDETLAYRTTVTGGSPVFAASGISSATTLSGFVAIAADGSTPGQASIALTAVNSPGLVLSDNVLVAGRGADGAAGVTVNGGTGSPGGYAPNWNTGGPGGAACGGGPGTGGQGADLQQVASSGCFVYCNCSNNNYPNSLGRNGAASGTVAGGDGGLRGGQGCGCGSGGDAGNGPPGSPGNPGACGERGGVPSTNATGSFTQAAWTPSTGGSGDPGQGGSGGGGGGSGGYASWLAGDFKVHDYSGRPGGGGGGGGCGGNGGTGGGQGGASIPLVLVASNISIPSKSVALIPGPGGMGGAGATGGIGGAGGPGQTGPPGHQNPINIFLGCSGTAPGNGGTGGIGGQGGAGAGGAGGNGGPSFGIAFVSGTSTGLASSVEIYPALPGDGGPLGAGGQNARTQCQGAAGTKGNPGFSNDSQSYVVYQ